MHLESLAIPDLKLIVPERFADARGFFSETYNRARLEAAGLVGDYVQDNHSHSRHRGTVRGLHFQIGPFAQDKLVRVVRGSVFDVCVDLRKSRPTFGAHVGVILSAADWNQIYVPQGFAHGFCTLEPDTEVVYKVSRPYSKEHERGIIWNDPALGITWPVDPGAAILSDKDATLPGFAEVTELFE